MTLKLHFISEAEALRLYMLGVLIKRYEVPLAFSITKLWVTTYSKSLLGTLQTGQHNCFHRHACKEMTFCSLLGSSPVSVISGVSLPVPSRLRAPAQWSNACGSRHHADTSSRRHVLWAVWGAVQLRQYLAGLPTSSPFSACGFWFITRFCYKFWYK